MNRTWLFADYSQAESRVIARLTPIPKLWQWYCEGVDVHAKVTNEIARVIQENKIHTPIVAGKQMFWWKQWGEYTKGDEERELCKRVVHGSNYDLGIGKLAITLSIIEGYAAIISKIYHTLFPEIKRDYHGWVRACIVKNRTIWMPAPVRFRKIFWDKIDEELYRSAYSCYPQCTVASMLNRTIRKACTVFREDHDEKFKEQWCAWYGKDNWDAWRKLRDSTDSRPQTILWGGIDVRLNIHDAGGISVPDDPDILQWTARMWRDFAEETIEVIDTKGKKAPMSIPVDFKVGPNWGELHDFKLV